jgi:hypothetical protein
VTSLVDNYPLYLLSHACNKVEQNLETIRGSYVRITIVPGGHCYDKIHNLSLLARLDFERWEAENTYYQERAFQVITFTISEEIVDDNNGNQKQDSHEYLEIEIHWVCKSPSNQDY